MTGSYGVDHAQGNYTCMRCGTLLGFMSNECPNCRQNELLEEANELRRKELEFQQEREREIRYREYQIQEDQQNRERQQQRRLLKMQIDSQHGEGTFEKLVYAAQQAEQQANENEIIKDARIAKIIATLLLIPVYLFWKWFLPLPGSLLVVAIFPFAVILSLLFVFGWLIAIWPS